MQISTDAVFENEIGPCSEKKIPKPSTIYAKTKLKGELIGPNSINIRTSIVGPSQYNKKGIWEWVNAQEQGARVEGYINQVWRGATTLQLAEFLVEITSIKKFNLIKKKTNIIHFCPNTKMTKYELLSKLAEGMKKDIKIGKKKSQQQIENYLISLHEDCQKNIKYKDNWSMLIGQYDVK